MERFSGENLSGFLHESPLNLPLIFLREIVILHTPVSWHWYTLPSCRVELHSIPVSALFAEANVSPEARLIASTTSLLPVGVAPDRTAEKALALFLAGQAHGHILDERQIFPPGRFLGPRD